MMFAFLCLFVFFLVAFLTFLRLARSKQLKTVAFFHPYCNAGGGGERVLWTAVEAIQNRYPEYAVVIYTGDKDASPEQILSNVEKRFKISLKNISFVYLSTRFLVEARYYPVFTLLLQSLASCIVALEAILKHSPHVVIDSMGYAFALPVFKYFGGCITASYVHYPTISRDMLSVVAEGSAAHNNRAIISRFKFLTQAKLIYYRLFAWLYGFIGRWCSDQTMVNSSWTKGHIDSLWCLNASLVYPPCDVEELSSLQPNSSLKQKEIRILSLAQFRPEKNHALQIEMLRMWRSLVPAQEFDENIRFVLVGSCRNEEDRARVAALKDKCSRYELNSNVEFHLDISWTDLKSEISKCNTAIHSMWNEHFGIGVVECMAAGLITVAHKSGGPMMDIVVPYNGEPTGFLGDTVESYIDAFEKIRNMSFAERAKMAANAKVSVARFSADKFKETFLKAVEPILK